MAKPQLIMRRPHVRDLPAPAVPTGYELRSFQPGDEAGWNRLMDIAFERTPGQSDFAREMAADAPYRPERVKLILDDQGTVVATASSWLQEKFGPEAGTLHWVATDPAHGGKGLGTSVSVAAMHQGASEGRTHLMLLTDDFRIAALKTYLRLDFRPVIAHRSHPRRWRKILKSLDWPDRFEAILDGPREEFD